MIKSLLYALQFLTVIPVKAGEPDDRKVKAAIIYFPIIGSLIGLVLAVAAKLLSFLNLGQLCINTMLLILLAFLTGGLHLDGLADTFDGIAGGKGKDEMLRIMRDPHIGTMGALSIFLTVILEIALLSELDINLKIQALLLMCLLSRWSMVMAMFLFPYARQEGKALVFFKNTDFGNFAFTSVITLFLVAAIWQLKGLLIFAVAASCTYIVGKFISSKVGGLTGDTLGAVNEIAQIIVLAAVYIIERSIYA